MRLGTFSQFAAESLKELKPLASASCKDLNDLDAQKFGLLQFEVFSDSKCIARFGASEPIGKMATAEHLGTSKSMVNMESTSNRHWIWPVLALVTIGIAAGLKDKQVSVGMPGLH
jgi:hypothetical protein